jgi:hypothetical protein
MEGSDLGEECEEEEASRGSQQGWRSTSLVNIFGVGLLVFSSATISNWHVLTSDLRIVGQIRWWQGFGSLCCRSVFCEIKDKKLICEVEWCLSVMSSCAGAL